MSFPTGGVQAKQNSIMQDFVVLCVIQSGAVWTNILDRSFQAITDFQEEDKCNNSSTNSNRATFRYHKPNNKQDNHHSEEAIQKKKKEKKKMRMSLKKQFFGINKINAQRL